MIKFEINKSFPLPHPIPGAEVAFSEINTSFFDVKSYMQNPTDNEVMDWRKGKLKYGLFELDKCPFFIVAFDGWNLDASINILKIKNIEDIDAWLNADGDIITLFLIDADTNILKAMRTISIPIAFAENLKNILEEQTNLYEDASQVERRIAEIQHTLSTANMISRIKMNTL